jgi:phosphatidylserine/phosphatidylglycerophosphate/cardiolipin synthase-like enzyme
MKYRFLTALGASVIAACSATSKEHSSTASSSTSSDVGGGGGGGGGGATTSAGGATTTSSSTSTSHATTTTTTTSSSSSSGSPTIGGTTAVTVYVTPDTAITSQIVSAIQGAKSSVHMTMYILDNSSIVSALVSAKKAGVDVKVVMNQTFPSGTVQQNSSTYSTLQAAGVGVVWRNGAPNEPSGYTHEKTFIVDGKEAWIMTMNLDNTAPKYNREYIAVDTDPTDVQTAEAVFEADFAGLTNTHAAPLIVSPDPPSNSRTALVALINSAKKTLDVEAEEFSDPYSNGVVTAVAAAAKRGVATRVILAAGNTYSSQVTAVSTVKAAGAKVVVAGGNSGSSTSSNPYIHAKAITVDCSGTTCARGFVGSENFSGGSLGYNRELGLIIANPTELAKIQTAIDADFSAGTPQ